MNILITGGTGFLGTELRVNLLRKGHHVTVITRSPAEYEEESAQNQQFIDWQSDLSAEMDRADAVVNLAGENLFGKRWTPGNKKLLYNSRIHTTRQLVEAIGSCSQRPDVMVSASAVGYYGDCGDAYVREERSPGEGFLSDLCSDWENAAMKAAKHGVRVVTPRLGIVLERGGGALAKMLLPFKLFVGGSVGDGSQYLPWVHMDDMCEAILFALENDTVKGAYNVAAPEPPTMDEFTSALGDVLNRPVPFRIPEFAVRLVLGEAADPILHSIRADSGKIRQEGFEFRFTGLREALADIL